MVVMTRYDGNSLKRSYVLEEEPVTMPRLGLPSDNNFHDMNYLHMRSASGFTPGSTTQYPQQQYSRMGTLSRRHSQKSRRVQTLLPGSATEEDDASPNWECILHSIQEIGIHRFLTLINKFCAIVLILISLWILWGRGFNTNDLKRTEKNMGITGFVGGLITAIGVSVTSQHHSNNKDLAKFQTWRRIIISIINSIHSVIIIVFGAIALSKLHSQKEAQNYALPSLTVNERTAFAAILIGIGILIGTFSILSIIFGGCGLFKIHKAEHQVKSARRRQKMVEYINPAYGTVVELEAFDDGIIGFSI